MYKLCPNPNVIIRISDNTNISVHPLNPNYLEYVQWLFEGNEPLVDEEITDGN